MNFITRNTDYAIQALLYIASADKELVSTVDLQSELNLPRPFMRKILQQLQQVNLLSSTKGNKGGFSLIASPDDIFVLDVMRVFQGEINLAECFLQSKPCPNRKTCPVRDKLKDIEAYAKESFKGVTIGGLLKSMN